MRFSGVALGSIFVWFVANGCAAPEGAAASSSSGGQGTTGASSGGGSPALACPPPATCDAGPVCLSLEDYHDEPLFSLRMSRLTFSAPAALKDPMVEKTVLGGVTPNIPGCGVSGPATFSWILQFNTSASTLQTGIAKIVTDPADGYTFINEPMMVGGATFPVSPVVFHGVVLAPDGAFSVQKGLDLNIPIFLDTTGTSFVIIPLHQARMFAGRVAPDHHNCIGRYDAEGLDPANGCQATEGHPSFLPGAKVDGYITLEEADTIVSTSFGTSLCVFITGKGDGGTPVNKCARTNGVITGEGDWCSTTNDASAGGCADAVQLAADFAASAVRVKN